MAYNVIMPKAGMAMEEGKIIRWFKTEGDKIECGEPLLEIETDKVNMEVESDAAGILLKIIKQPGDTVPVTQVIGIIGEAGEKPDIVTEKPVQAKTGKPAGGYQEKAAAVLQNGEKIAATPLAKKLAKEKGIPLGSITPTGYYGEIKAKDVTSAKTQTIATPLARKMAQDMGIDLGGVLGSGYNGKINSEDIAKLAQQPATVFAEADKKPLSGIRKIIAKRMLQSHLEIPPVTLNTKVDVTDLSWLRQKINENLGSKISFNDMIIKAVAMALKERPDINISYEGENIITHPFINIGVAVALTDGLIVPVIRNADRLSLQEISDAAKKMASRAREGKLQPEEYNGGTFTVSNLGMFGITSFTPIINQPESAILGVCAIEDELAMDDSGKITKKKMLGLSLTFDHRSIDGAKGATFLQLVGDILKNPIKIIM